MKHIFFFSTFLSICGFYSQIPELQNASDVSNELYLNYRKPPFNPIRYVNPFIGTGGHGHTFPGATAPYGMVQLSPDTRYEGWDGCGGYHYSDSIIYGFSHTHLSGTGIPDYADLLVVPQSGKLNKIPGYLDPKGYGSKFKHENEVAKAGSYAVLLNDPGIQVKLTASERAGYHSYTFLKKGKRFIILDLDYRDKVISADFEIKSDSCISGHRISSSWASKQHFYFYLQSSIPFNKTQEINVDGQHKLVLFFPKNCKEIELKVGISSCDEAGAERNMKQEIGTKNFDECMKQTQNQWQKELSKIEIQDKDEEKKTIFYSALYHTMVVPNIFSDVDGRYRGRDNIIHQINGLPQYTVFSLWDTYRAAHPLYTIIDQKRTSAYIQTFLRQYKEGGDLPVWELSGNETECMIGFHSVSVIADAYIKGIRDFDSKLALKAMVETAQLDEFGKKLFNKYGLLSADWESESVSKSLEYGYDHWCVSQMAKTMGNDSLATAFLNRSFNFLNHFDPSTRFMRARRGAQWFTPFDPTEVNFNYTEANSWQYSLYAPHHPELLTNLIGGKLEFESWLDNLFSTKMQLSGRVQADITGLIGQYAHGNEPSHHMAYMYNYTLSPYKTQLYVDSIQTNMYHNLPDGLSGNEDCGQMSAWYVLSALGFYPISPGNGNYELGHPLFRKAILHLENGKNFTIETQGNQNNIYSNNIKLNGSSISHQIKHEDIMNGGSLEFDLNEQPQEFIWDKVVTMYPNQIPADFIPVPFIKSGERIFEDSLIIEMGMVSINQPEKHLIYYSIETDGTSSKWVLYNNPFQIDKSCKIMVKGVQNSLNSPKESAVVSSSFIKKNKNETLILETEYAKSYAASGPNTLIDKIRGSNDFRTGDWQGFQGKNVVAIVKFNNPVQLTEVGVSYIRDIGSWIFDPSKIQIEISTDGINFVEGKELIIPAVQHGSTEKDIFTVKSELKLQNIKAIRYTISNQGKCPSWHLGNGNDTWLFLDELIFHYI